MRLLLAFLPLLIAGCDLIPKTQLEQVQDRGVLRVLTRNSATTYYEGPYGPAGVEYDLAEGFARYLGVKLHIQVPDNLSEILQGIQSGGADMAAAGLTATDERRQQFNFSSSYQRITPQLVYRIGTPAPQNLGDLHGSFEVVADSSHAERLRALREEYPDMSFTENNELESEQLLGLVWDEVIDYTVADSNEVAFSRRFYPELRVAFDISKPQPLAWAFPPGDDHSLVDKANEYLRKQRENGHLDRLLEKYYGYVADFDYVGTRRYLQHIDQRLPRYQSWFEKAGKDTGIDWRLLAAIGYQESHWNPVAVSPTGVKGIMMLTQDTARMMGVADREDPRDSILGGARYLNRVKNKIPTRIPEPDRTWFALAAYNIGFGHLEDARIITEMQDGDPDVWADVRTSLPLLTQKKWYSRVKRGYARGYAPVHYVDNVRSYYEALMWLTSGDFSDPVTTRAEPAEGDENNPT